MSESDERRMEAECQHGHVQNARLNIQVDVAKQHAPIVALQKINT